MNAPAEPDKFAALQMILAEYLRTSLDAQKIAAFPPFVNIPLNRVRSGSHIKYVSAVALRLASYPDSAMSLAQQIAKNLHSAIQFDQFQPPAVSICQDLQISIATPGLIYLELGAMGLASWLQYQTASTVLILNSLPELNNTVLHRQFKRDSEQIFLVLQSHACCHRILRAADAAFHDCTAQIDPGVACQALTWQTTEWQLVEQLIDVIDELALASSRSRSKPLDSLQISRLAYQLSQRFQAFHAACLPGRVATQDRLASRYLRLVLLTQRFLQLLLGLLDLPAPEQL